MTLSLTCLINNLDINALTNLLTNQRMSLSTLRGSDPANPIILADDTDQMVEESKHHFAAGNKALNKNTKVAITVVDLCGDKKQKQQLNENARVVKECMDGMMHTIKELGLSNKTLCQQKQDLELLLKNAMAARKRNSGQRKKPRKEGASDMSNKFNSLRRKPWVPEQLGELLLHLVCDQTLHTANQLLEAVGNWLNSGTEEANIVKAIIVQKFGSVECDDAQKLLLGQIRRELKTLLKDANAKVDMRKEGGRNVYFKKSSSDQVDMSVDTSVDPNVDPNGDPNGDSSMSSGGEASTSSQPPLASSDLELDALVMQCLDELVNC